jgi:hypothetical protein
MKKFVLAAALSVAATSVFAGGLAEPVMEPEVVEAATSSSAGGFIVPLLLLRRTDLRINSVKRRQLVCRLFQFQSLALVNQPPRFSSMTATSAAI